MSILKSEQCDSPGWFVSFLWWVRWLFTQERCHSKVTNPYHSSIYVDHCIRRRGHTGRHGNFYITWGYGDDHKW